MSSLKALREPVSRTAREFFESPGGGARLLPMEGLRGLAVLLVYFVHVHAFFGQYLASYPRLYSVSEYLGRVGNCGVDLFFVLSGFIIYSALVHKSVPYFSFLQRRVKRIYPTFLVVLGSYLVLSLLIPSENKVPLHAWAATKYVAANILLLPGFFRIAPIVTVAWSLSYEFAFYLAVPLVVLILRHQKQGGRRRVALLIIMAALFSLSEAFVFDGSHIRMLSFLSGMLLQEITSSGTIRAYLTRRGQWISIIALALTASYHFAFQSRGSGTGGSGVFSLVLMTVAILFFVLYALEFGGVLQKVCTWTPMRYWGNISYSYYLVHGATLNAIALWLARLQPQRHLALIYFTVLVVGLAITWFTASVLYLLVEKPVSLAPKKPRTSMPATVVTSNPWPLQRREVAVREN